MMRFIISQALLILILISIAVNLNCQIYYPKSRLSIIISEIDDVKSNKSERTAEAELFKDIDINCVKNFLNLPQNDNMFVNKYEKMIVDAAASLKCSDEDRIFKFILNEFVRSNLKQWTKCFERKLQKIEPESPLIRNIDISEGEIDECKEIVNDEDLRELQGNCEEIFGPLDVFSCGAMTGAADYLKFISKGALIKFGDIDEGLRSTEMEKLKEWLKGIAFKTVECMIKRYEKDPKAYHKNDTLNYFFEQSIEQVIPDEENPSEYNKIYEKIMDSIDLKCTKEHLNLLELGNNPILKVEAKILIGSSMSKCITIDDYNFMDLLLHFGMNDFERHEDYVFCSRYGLQQLEPDSKLIKDFVVGQESVKKCKFFQIAYVEPFDYNFKTYKKTVGSDLKETTCGILSDEFAKIFSYKALLIDVEKDEELRKSEALKLFDVVKSKLQQFAYCVLKRVK